MLQNVNNYKYIFPNKRFLVRHNVAGGARAMTISTSLFLLEPPSHDRLLITSVWKPMRNRLPHPNITATQQNGLYSALRRTKLVVFPLAHTTHQSNADNVMPSGLYLIRQDNLGNIKRYKYACKGAYPVHILPSRQPFVEYLYCCYVDLLPNYSAVLTVTS